MTRQHPHGNQRVLIEGYELDDANAVVILLHGRGSPAANIIQLSDALLPRAESEQKICWLAPQANGNTWYPHRFIVPTERNEPYLGSALAKIDELVDAAVESGVHTRQVLLVGFSQGACLALEYVARGTRQVAGAAAFAGGLIGDPAVDRLPLPDLIGTSIFLGCGELDEHIDVEIAGRSAQRLAGAGATVDFRRYPGVNHTILDDELDAGRALVAALPLIGPRPAVS